MQQEKALEELEFELADPTKKKSKYNNRKMVFDAECRKLFLKISARHGLDIDMEPVYGRASYFEKADYIVKKQRSEKSFSNKVKEIGGRYGLNYNKNVTRYGGRKVRGYYGVCKACVENPFDN